MWLFLLATLSPAHALSCDDAARALLTRPEIRDDIVAAVIIGTSAGAADAMAKARRLSSSEAFATTTTEFWTPLLTPAVTAFYDEDLVDIARPFLFEHLSCGRLKSIVRRLERADRRGEPAEMGYLVSAQPALAEARSSPDTRRALTLRLGGVFLEHLPRYEQLANEVLCQIRPEASEPLPPTAIPEEASPLLVDTDAPVAPAPASFQLHLQTTRGLIVIAVDRAHDPLSVDRLHHLTTIGFFDNNTFFRVAHNFVAQFGMSPYPAVTEAWERTTLQASSEALSNERGVLVMARGRSPESRSTQFYINLKDNTGIDKQGWRGIGRVVEGLDVLDALNHCYGEQIPVGRGPTQTRIRHEGDAYLRAGFPGLDRIERAWIETD